MLKKNDAQDCLLALVYQLLHYFHWHVAHGQLLQYFTTMLALKEFTHLTQDTCNGKFHSFQTQVHNEGSSQEYSNLFLVDERFISPLE